LLAGRQEKEDEPMNRKNYLCIEAPDNTATVDFLGKFGCAVSIKIEKNRHGKPELYVIAKACDDRSTILGEIVAEVPRANDRE
jgi:hypothetical protein